MKNITPNILLGYLSDSWKKPLEHDYPKIFDVQSPEWINLCLKLSSYPFKPQIDHIFNALNNCPPETVKCVILGIDPYTTTGQPHGYCFSTMNNKGIGALQNIFTELSNEYCVNMNFSPNLEKWATEGVLLLNSILTAGDQSKSHAGLWEHFTGKVIEYINNHNKCVFMAWGGAPRNILQEYNVKDLLVASHPSFRNSLSNQVPFIGCNHFKECNDILRKYNILPIRWLVIQKQPENNKTGVRRRVRRTQPTPEINNDTGEEWLQ